MILLEVTSQTWYITGIGFGMVLVLLFLFVYVMKLLGVIMQPKKKNVEQPKAEEKQVPQTADDATKAAIAFTLQQYYYGVHDLVETHLTVKHHVTAWNIITTENN